ncbi:General stress protein 39 [compost metagenome]
MWTPLNPAAHSAEDVKDFGKQSGMKRPAQPEELSAAYVCLAAPICASYVRGIVLPVTGSVGRCSVDRRRSRARESPESLTAFPLHFTIAPTFAALGLVSPSAAPATMVRPCTRG